jgi:hypothetical protein
LLDLAITVRFVEAVVTLDRAEASAALDGIPGAKRFPIDRFFDSPDPLDRLQIIQLVAVQLRSAGEWIAAGTLAISVWRALIHDRLALAKSTPATRLMCANIADFAASALADAGVPRRVFEHADEFVEVLVSLGLDERATALKLTVAEASIMQGAYESAAALLEQFRRSQPNPEDSPIYVRLRDKLDDLLRAVDKPDTPSAPFQEILSRSLAAMTKVGPQYQQVVARLGEALRPDGEAPNSEAWSEFVRLGFPPAIRNFEAAEAAVASIGESGRPMFILSSISRKMQELLPLADTPQSHMGLAGMAIRAAGEADILELWEDALTFRWLAGVAFRRAHAFTEARKVLRDLREKIRLRQLGVADPLLRAALAVYLPHLAGVSAALLFELGEPGVAELFEVIEGAKGRILNDLLEQRLGHPLDGSLQAVLALVKKGPERAHYLTLLADADALFAVLVSTDGSQVAARIDLPRPAIVASAERIAVCNEGDAELGWAFDGAIDGLDPWQRGYDEALALLHPLGAWFEQLLTADTIRDGDVLCLSLDGPLFNVPLQALDVAGTPIGLRFGCTIVPSAGTLVACAEMRGGSQRRSSVAAIVPLASEDETAARRNLDAIGSLAPLDLLGGPTADLDRVLTSQTNAAWVHIAAHGTFVATDPLGSSGVLLAEAGKYPPGRGAQGNNLLSAKALATMNLQGAHVAFRACVSGKTTEVTSREALGMIWAAFQAGATSIMAGQWDVWIPSASVLFDEFYGAARKQGERGEQLAVEAYRQALTTVRAHSRTYAHPYHYAGIAFYGYWR